MKNEYMIKIVKRMNSEKFRSGEDLFDSLPRGKSHVLGVGF